MWLHWYLIALSPFARAFKGLFIPIQLAIVMKLIET